MIQRHRILINEAFSANTLPPEVVTGSSLTNTGGVQATNIQGLGGNVVDANNVRGFLKGNENSRIIIDFYSYFSANTTPVEYFEILGSDAKLASIFNNYYQSSVINNEIPTDEAIQNALEGTSGFTVIDNSIYNYNGIAPGKGLQKIPLSINSGDRNLKVYSALTTYTIEQSYYVPVFITRNHTQMDRESLYFDEVIDKVMEQTVFSPIDEDENPNPYDYYGSSGDEGYDNNGGNDSIIGEIGETSFSPPSEFFDQFTEDSEGQSKDPDGVISGDTGGNEAASPAGQLPAGGAGETRTSPGESGIGRVSPSK